MQPKEYVLFIFSNNVKLYWKPEGKGYTSNIAEAGLFTESQADKQVKCNRGDQKEHITIFETELASMFRGARRKLETLNRYYKRTLKKDS